MRKCRIMSKKKQMHNHSHARVYARAHADKHSRPRASKIKCVLGQMWSDALARRTRNLHGNLATGSRNCGEVQFRNFDHRVTSPDNWTKTRIFMQGLHLLSVTALFNPSSSPSTIHPLYNLHPSPYIHPDQATHPNHPTTHSRFRTIFTCKSFHTTRPNTPSTMSDLSKKLPTTAGQRR
jgi:hypothetical protein